MKFTTIRNAGSILHARVRRGHPREDSHQADAQRLQAIKKDSAERIGGSPRCTKFNPRETFTI
jgi:hypothetical protein